MKKFSNVMELELFEVPVPRKTESYSPVSHKNIIELVKEELDKHNLIISNAEYKVSSEGQKVIGYYDIKQEGYDEMGMRLAFRNSYDKSMSVAFVAGSNVWICGNGCVSGEMKVVRKHTGSVVEELTTKAISSINQLDDTFERHNRHKDRMKEIHMDKTLYSQLVGEMFIEQEIITSTQLGIMKDELYNPTYEAFSDDNLWSLYNHATHALKTSHPLDYINRHVKLHEFITTEFGI